MAHTLSHRVSSEARPRTKRSGRPSPPCSTTALCEATHRGAGRRGPTAEHGQCAYGRRQHVPLLPRGVGPGRSVRGVHLSLPRVDTPRERRTAAPARRAVCGTPTSANRRQLEAAESGHVAAREFGWLAPPSGVIPGHGVPIPGISSCPAALFVVPQGAAARSGVTDRSRVHVGAGQRDTKRRPFADEAEVSLGRQRP